MKHTVKLTNTGRESLENQARKHLELGYGDALHKAGITFAKWTEEFDHRLIAEDEIYLLTPPNESVQVYCYKPLINAAIEAAQQNTVSFDWISMGPGSGRGFSPAIDFEFAGRAFHLSDGVLKSSLSKDFEHSFEDWDVPDGLDQDLVAITHRKTGLSFDIIKGFNSGKWEITYYPLMKPLKPCIGDTLASAAQQFIHHLIADHQDRLSRMVFAAERIAENPSKERVKQLQQQITRISRSLAKTAKPPQMTEAEQADNYPPSYPTGQRHVSH